jgi:DNA-binding NarL/FixJ family response regulator
MFVSSGRTWPVPARGRQVLDLLAEGASSQQIAGSLGISLKTVQNHVFRVLGKLQAADQPGCLPRKGITPQPPR